MNRLSEADLFATFDAGVAKHVEVQRRRREVGVSAANARNVTPVPRPEKPISELEITVTGIFRCAATYLRYHGKEPSDIVGTDYIAPTFFRNGRHKKDKAWILARKSVDSYAPVAESISRNDLHSTDHQGLAIDRDGEWYTLYGDAAKVPNLSLRGGLLPNESMLTYPHYYLGLPENDKDPVDYWVHFTSAFIARTINGS